MATLQSLKDSWSSKGLLDEEGRFAPTLIEDVGSASAENVRSAALMRWAKRNGEDAREWLKSVLGHEVDALSPRREVQLRDYNNKSCGRIDLELKQADKTSNRILAEVKWCASPDHEQMENYNRGNEVKERSKLILLSPIEVVHEYYGSHHPILEWAQPFPENVVFTTWTALRKYLHSSYLEDEILALTVERWSTLDDFVSKCAEEKAIPDLLELMRWLTDEETQAQKDYRTLSIQLVLAKLSDSMCAQLGKDEWFRGYPYEGSKGDDGGDLTVDIYHKVKSFKAFDGNASGVTKGMLVCIRLRVRGVRHPELQVQIGTTITPYGKKQFPNPPMDIIKRRRDEIVSLCREVSERRGVRFNYRTPNHLQRWQHQVSKTVLDWDEIETSVNCYKEVISNLSSLGR